jgi:transposase
VGIADLVNEGRLGSMDGRRADPMAGNRMGSKRWVTLHRFMTVPGVGPITAFSPHFAIDKPDRFKQAPNVGAYLGLTSRRYQSGAGPAGKNIEVRRSLYPDLPL